MGELRGGGCSDEIDFTLPVLMAADCDVCPACEEPWCQVCDEHYSDCAHPGPDSEIGYE